MCIRDRSRAVRAVVHNLEKPDKAYQMYQDLKGKN